MGWMLGALALFLLIVGWWLARKSAQEAETTGIAITGVSVLHSDTGGGSELAEPLKSEKYGLVGKPDYILQTREGLVAVEVKPTRQAQKPFESDLMQLAAYCLLLEEAWHVKPAYGLLRYANLSFRVEWSNSLRQQLLDVLEEMRELAQQPAVLGQSMPPPQHDMTVRCEPCGFRYVCWPD